MDELIREHADPVEVALEPKAPYVTSGLQRLPTKHVLVIALPPGEQVLDDTVDISLVRMVGAGDATVRAALGALDHDVLELLKADLAHKGFITARTRIIGIALATDIWCDGGHDDMPAG